jgi:hypothetical protein
MKRAWIIFAALAFIALPALGQIRGAPASVTSMAPWRSFNPGPPASVTSLGPNGFSNPCSSPGVLIPSAMGCTPTQFTTGFFFPDPRDRGTINTGHRRRHNGSNWYPGYYAVPVPYAYPVAAEPEPDQEYEPDPPAPTMFEHRATYERVPADSSRYGTHYQDGREKAKPALAPEVEDRVMPSTVPAREEIPIVLIYRDGHEQEVRNYAIVGQTLYDLGTFVAHKIPLAELNLKATIKANEDRGVEFSVPASVKLD